MLFILIIFPTLIIDEEKKVKTLREDDPKEGIQSLTLCEEAEGVTEREAGCDGKR